MKALIIPSWYEAGSNQQMGSFFREQAVALNNAGIEVIVVDATFLSTKTLFNRKVNSGVRRIVDNGLITYIRKIPSFGMYHFEKLAAKIFEYNLKRIYKCIVNDGHKIDIIHAHSFFPAGIAAVRFGKRNGIPVIVTEHSSTILSMNLNKTRKNLLVETVEKSNTFICVSQVLKKAVNRCLNFSRDIKVIPNMVSPLFHPLLPPNLNLTQSFTFISVGNLIASKRFDLTINAFADKFCGKTNFKLIIIGAGEMNSKLQQIVLQRNVAHQVEIMGRLDRIQVARELSKADVFVLPSDYETFGVVYIEALASGIPVIATRNGGADEIINESNGVLVDVNNVIELGEAMEFMYNKYLMFNKRKISEGCQANYGETVVVKAIMKEYEKIKGK